MTPEPLSIILTEAAVLAPGARHQAVYRYAAVLAREAEAVASRLALELQASVAAPYAPLVELVAELAAEHAKLEGRKAQLAPEAQA